LDKATVSEDTPDQRKKFRRKVRGLAYLRSSDSSGFGRRHLRSPARNFDGLAASQVMGGEGKGREGCGLFMGVARASKRAGSEGD
jgi:hypothetical protein